MWKTLLLVNMEVEFMFRKLKFYVKGNRILCSIIAITFIINIVFNLTNYSEYMTRGYFDYINSTYYIIQNILMWLNIIALASCIILAIVNSFEIFTNARSIKATFNTLNFIYYFINPLLILLAILFLMHTIDQFAFVSIYMYNMFNILNTLLDYFYVVIGLYFAYFSILILYLEINHYQIKYASLKKKAAYVVLHVIVTLIILASLTLLSINITSSYLFSDMMTLEHFNYKLYDMYYLFDTWIFDKTYMHIIFYATFITITAAIINKCIALQRNTSNRIFVSKVAIAFVSVMLMVVVVIKINKVSEVQNMILEDKTGGNTIVEVNVAFDGNMSYKDFENNIKREMRRYNIFDYDLRFSSIAYNNTALYFDVFFDFIDLSEDIDDYREGGYYIDAKTIGASVYDLKDLDEYKIVEGKEPTNVIEVLIPEALAEVLKEKFGIETTEKLIGNYLDSYYIIGIIEDSEQTKEYDSSRDFKPQYFYRKDVDYPMYTHMEVTEDSMNAFIDETNRPGKNLLTGGISYSYGDGYSPGSITMVATVYNGNVDIDKLVNQNYFTDYSDTAVEVSLVNRMQYYSLLNKVTANPKLNIALSIVICVSLFYSLIYLVSMKQKGARKNV